MDRRLDPASAARRILAGGWWPATEKPSGDGVAGEAAETVEERHGH
jgi:hypothetical protein